MAPARNAVRQIAPTALDYLDTTLDRTVRLFATASAVKAMIAVVEGSEIGLRIGASGTIQLGDVVQPAYDHVDMAWRTLIVSMAALLHDGKGRLRRLLRDAFRTSMLVMIGVILVLLTAVWSGGRISQSITSPHVTAAEATFARLDAEVGQFDARGGGFFGDVRRACSSSA